MEEYTNANGEVYTFTKQGINKVLMEGNFKDHRVGGKPGDIEYINPRGGPFIKKGQTITGIDFNGIGIGERGRWKEVDDGRGSG